MSTEKKNEREKNQYRKSLKNLNLCSFGIDEFFGMQGRLIAAFAEHAS